MPDGRRLPLRILLARLVVLGLLPVAILSAWAVANTLVARREGIERSVLELSRALASAVDSELDATRQGLAAMGRSPALLRGDLRAFYDEASNEVAAHPDWRSIILTDARGTPLFKTTLPFGSADTNIVDPASLEQTIRTGMPSVGRLLPGPQKSAFAVRVPVFEQGQMRYVLTAAVLPDRMVQVLRRQRAPQGWAIAVFDASHVRVARARDQSATVGGKAMPELARLFDSPGQEGIGRSITTEGEPVYTGFTRLAPEGWIVAVGAPTADMERLALHSLAWYLAGISISSLACFLLARRISRRIGDGVARIRDEAVQMSQGQALAGTRSDIQELDDVARPLTAASARLSQNARTAREALAAADAASSAKDEFLAVLGHELRNPLAPMLTALQLIDLRSGELMARERQIMRRQIDHMRRLVDDLLDVSRITRGILEIRRERVEMRAVVEHALETVGLAAAARDEPIRVSLPAEPVWLLGDETRLVQAVANLLSNALRYGSGTDVQVILEAAAGTARVTVSDQGVGMSAETLASVFEPFFQAPQGPARRTGGLGLGLAIVRAIARLHGGDVCAGSAGPGKGSWFSLELPLVDEPLREVHPEPPRERRRVGRIAVVDDNVDALEMIVEALRTAGHEVRAMSDSTEALREIPSFAPDVAVLDLGMPGLDGFELAAALRATRWTGRLVALSGYGQDHDKARAREAGFAVHLTKPVEIEQLLTEVESLVRPRSPSGEKDGASRPER